MSSLKGYKSHQTHDCIWVLPALHPIGSSWQLYISTYLGVTIQHDLNILIASQLKLSFLQRNLKLNNKQLKETVYF